MGACQTTDEDMNTVLLTWLRDNETKFSTTGSRRFFGDGNDTDFLVDVSTMPWEIQLLLPEPQFDTDYGDAVVILHDDQHPTLGHADYIVASPERTAEFEFATEHFLSIKNDPILAGAEWSRLRRDKTMRIAVFRALRHAFPNSTLTH